MTLQSGNYQGNYSHNAPLFGQANPLTQMNGAKVLVSGTDTAVTQVTSVVNGAVSAVPQPSLFAQQNQV